jgi:hypothetical protein
MSSSWPPNSGDSNFLTKRSCNSLCGCAVSNSHSQSQYRLWYHFSSIDEFVVAPNSGDSSFPTKRSCNSLCGCVVSHSKRKKSSWFSTTASVKYSYAPFGWMQKWVTNGGISWLYRGLQISTVYIFFNPLLFASCTNTFSKCCEITTTTAQNWKLDLTGDISDCMGAQLKLLQGCWLWFSSATPVKCQVRTSN